MLKNVCRHLSQATVISLVELNQTTDVPTQLQVGQTSENIEVSAGGVELVDTTTTTLSKGFNERQAVDLAQAAFGGQSNLIIGNVVGSNIANVLLILGLSAMAAPLVVPRRMIRLEVPPSEVFPGAGALYNRD